MHFFVLYDGDDDFFLFCIVKTTTTTIRWKTDSHVWVFKYLIFVKFGRLNVPTTVFLRRI